MSEKTYFMVWSSDGDIKINGPMTGREFRAMLKRDPEDYADVEWLDKMPDDLQRLGRRLVLIEGRIVVPKPVQLVTEYKLPEDL